MKRLTSPILLIIILGASTLFTGCGPEPKGAKSTKYTSAARHKATMRSYKVLGKRYNPTYVEVGQVMHGISSWYGPNFHGKQTSNGEVYNMHARTAAHKTWPMDTMVKVNNLVNGKSTIVRINDRGPFVRGRVIDCSYTAGKELGLDKMGIAKVSLEVVGFAGKVESPAAIARQKREHTQQRMVLSNFGVQVGAFRRYQGAKAYQRKYSAIYRRYNTIIRRFDDINGGPLNRVWLMGFRSEEEARDFKAHNDLEGAFIVRN
ncbi:endolytic peptidoglycan transglycosylase RlpA [Sulfurovum sp. TSL6]|uniref:septal ring lytic transglycosylase RlpA family protein n=1 Tax=Sulfurovum sp. TSL6 TaxID=2826995 RepID=UPI001CC7E755|nr:septal ring lytic transglycosylase RlpA family protein [Sulfurovum sp. TSL6]GIU00415.1 endolytic peptidoglycan transglycosylase RlpA [Sulfurovum sp. TSL6]